MAGLGMPGHWKSRQPIYVPKPGAPLLPRFRLWLTSLQRLLLRFVFLRQLLCLLGVPLLQLLRLGRVAVWPMLRFLLLLEILPLLRLLCD